MTASGRGSLVLALVLGAFAFCGMAAAQTAQPGAELRDYLAARDAAIATIKARLDAGPIDDAVGAQDRKALADLEMRLRRIVGDVTLPGFGPAKSNLETLIQELGFGQLDGLVVASADKKSSVVVTTTPLLTHWLRGHKNWWGKKEAPMPPDIAGAARSEAFYTQATSSGAAMVGYGALPVTKPKGAAFAFAILAARTQDLSPPAPDQMFVTMVQGGRVFIANAPLAERSAPDPACASLRAGYTARAKAAFEAYRASELKDKRQFERSTALEREGDRAERRCFADRMHAAARAKAAQQAQAMIEAMAGR